MDIHEDFASQCESCGHRWSIGHAIEALAPAEVQRRYVDLVEAGR